MAEEPHPIHITSIHISSNPKDYPIGGYFEDCAFHPCHTFEINPHDPDNIKGNSMVEKGRWGNCSLKHCGLRPLTKEQAEYWAKFGPPEEHIKEIIRGTKNGAWWDESLLKRKLVSFETVPEGVLAYDGEYDEFAVFKRSDTRVDETLWGGKLVWIDK